MIQEVLAAATSTQGTNEIVPYMSAALAILKVQTLLKGLDVYQRFVKAFPGSDKVAHRFVAAVGSLIAALGIGYVIDYDPHIGGKVIFTIPAVSVLLHGLYDFTIVYLFQDVAYDATRRPAGMPVLGGQ